MGNLPFLHTDLIGLGWAALSRQNRSVQDIVLRTSVIYDWENRPRANGPA
jgi:hypothetical protein